MKITDISGKEHSIDCIACAIQSGEIALPVERITETENFVVEQDLEIPIEGFLIVVSKRHIFSVDELSDNEITELSILLKKTRKAMRQSLGVSWITIVQEENTATSHFHIWLFPWHKWMAKKWSGKLEEIKEIMKFSRKEMSGEEVLSRVKESSVKVAESMKSKR